MTNLGLELRRQLAKIGLTSPALELIEALRARAHDCLNPSTKRHFWGLRYTADGKNPMPSRSNPGSDMSLAEFVEMSNARHGHDWQKWL